MRDRRRVELEWITPGPAEAISAIRLSVRRGLESAAVSVIDRATSEERRRKCPIARGAEKRGRERERSERGRERAREMAFTIFTFLLRSGDASSLSRSDSEEEEEEEDNGYERVTSLGQSVWLGRRRLPSPGKPE